ncbi:MAG: hypothetical protein GY861_24850 [bacterium]|nr:hypothetical protein [bacterium]
MAMYRNLELRGEKAPAKALRRYSEQVDLIFPGRSDNGYFGVNESDSYSFRLLDGMAKALADFGFDNEIVVEAVRHQKERAELSEKFGLKVKCYSAWLTLGEKPEEFDFLAFQQYKNLHKILSVRKKTKPICLEELLMPFISREYLNKPPLLPYSHEAIGGGCGSEDLPYKEYSGQGPH